ncbi:MAG: hypothetical protein LBL58_12530 [Tannerellaceae bacterium]|nr:hypothetical protein [Tannerellaceae bacterium]
MNYDNILKIEKNNRHGKFGKFSKRIIASDKSPFSGYLHHNVGGAAACSDDKRDGERQFAVLKSPRRLGVDGCRRLQMQR